MCFAFETPPVFRYLLVKEKLISYVEYFLNRQLQMCLQQFTHFFALCFVELTK